MSAGALPPEVVFHILSFLASLGPLAPYSSVCRQWQEIIEKWTFCSIRLTSDQFAEFRRSLSPSKRRSYVRHLKLVALLPGYDKAARAQIENVEDRDQNNQAFTHAVYTCWEILSSWSQNHGNFLSLDLSAISPSDWRADPNGMRRRRWACHFPDQDYLGWRYEQSYLQLTGNTLPPVHIVGHLFVDGGNTYRKIAPSTVSKMVNALPQLQKIRALLYDNERKDQALRDSLRNGNFHCHEQENFLTRIQYLLSPLPNGRGLSNTLTCSITGHRQMTGTSLLFFAPTLAKTHSA